MATTTAPATGATVLGAPADAARRAIAACWGIGLLLLVSGGVIAGAMFTQSVGGMFAGLALASVGQLVVLVALIATGVRLGVESARR